MNDHLVSSKNGEYKESEPLEEGDQRKPWDPWAVKPDSEREVWDFVPLMRVGPLHLTGMEHKDVEQVLGERSNPIGYGPDFDTHEVTCGKFRDVGVTTHYEDGLLRAVAVDARVGPRVRFLDEVELIGRPPSEVANWFLANHEGLGVLINQHGDPCSDQLGLVLNTQRAGDILLSGAVFVSRQWADSCGDTQESRVPGV